MYKYRAVASFHIWPEICQLSMEATKALLVSRGAENGIANFREFWADLRRYAERKRADGFTEEAILSPGRVTLRYGVDRWVKDGLPADVCPYKLEQPEEFEFRLSREGHHEPKAGLQVWTTDLKGLSKLVTRIQTAWQVRECHPLRGKTLLASCFPQSSKKVAPVILTLLQEKGLLEKAFAV